MKIFYIFLLFISHQAVAMDISNPANLLFAADKSGRFIDVIDITRKKNIYRLKTSRRVDDLAVTPYAPYLFYTNINKKLLAVYDLKVKKTVKEISLPVIPRHMVLDTTGSRLAISDSKEGGFVLLSAYSHRIIFSLPDFPPTGDVLFSPNEVDIYYSNDKNSSIGIIDINTRLTHEMSLVENHNKSRLSSPSRSLDGRYIYITNIDTGDIYSLKAYSKSIHKTFNIGSSPVRPYTTPEGIFLYMMDRDSGRLLSIEQHQFSQFADINIGKGIDLVTVGRFDRMNLFLSTGNNHYYILDNNVRRTIHNGTLKGIPLDSQGSVDGITAYIAFKDIPEIAAVDLEKLTIDYIPATDNGTGAYTLGLSNNVCH